MKNPKLAGMAYEDYKKMLQEKKGLEGEENKKWNQHVGTKDLKEKEKIFEEWCDIRRRLDRQDIKMGVQAQLIVKYVFGEEEAKREGRKSNAEN